VVGAGGGEGRGGGGLMGSSTSASTISRGGFASGVVGGQVGGVAVMGWGGRIGQRGSWKGVVIFRLISSNR